MIMSQEEIKEELLDTQFNFPNGGFIRLLDCMGSDQSIVDAARVCTDSHLKEYKSSTKRLLRYLWRKTHESPYEQAEVQLMVQLPITAMRQWVRHRTGSVCERSMRSCLDLDPPYLQQYYDEQGNILTGEVISELMHRDIANLDEGYQIYHDKIEAGVAKECARDSLPLNAWTRMVWKMDLRNWFNFLNQRMRPNAQKCIREYATCIGENIMAKLFPLSWQAFCDYTLYGVRLSSNELSLIKTLLGKVPQKDLKTCFHLIKAFDVDEWTESECNEFLAKFELELGDV